MTFYILRFILLFLIFAATYVVFRAAAKCSAKKSVILGAVISLVITTAVSIFPLENMVIDFNSPESAFEYFRSGEIEEIVYGSDSCLVIYSDSRGTFKDCVFLNSGDDYKLPSYFTQKRVAHIFTENGLFNTYKTNGTSDYYVQGSVPGAATEDIRVFDGGGNEISADIVRIDHTGFIYFRLGSFRADYYLSVAGKIQPLG